DVAGHLCRHVIMRSTPRRVLLAVAVALALELARAALAVATTASCASLRPDCRPPLRPRDSSLLITDRTPDTDDRVVWKWRHGAARRLRGSDQHDHVHVLRLRRERHADHANERSFRRGLRILLLLAAPRDAGFVVSERLRIPRRRHDAGTPGGSCRYGPHHA